MRNHLDEMGGEGTSREAEADCSKLEIRCSVDIGSENSRVKCAQVSGKGMPVERRGQETRQNAKEVNSAELTVWKIEAGVGNCVKNQKKTRNDHTKPKKKKSQGAARLIREGKVPV